MTTFVRDATVAAGIIMRCRMSARTTFRRWGTPRRQRAFFVLSDIFYNLCISSIMVDLRSKSREGGLRYDCPCKAVSFVLSDFDPSYRLSGRWSTWMLSLDMASRST